MTIDHWEAEANGGYGQIVKDDRIISLINLIREKDQQLEEVLKIAAQLEKIPEERIADMHFNLIKILALTKELK